MISDQCVLRSGPVWTLSVSKTTLLQGLWSLSGGTHSSAPTPTLFKCILVHPDWTGWTSTIVSLPTTSFINSHMPKLYHQPTHSLSPSLHESFSLQLGHRLKTVKLRRTKTTDLNILYIHFMTDTSMLYMVFIHTAVFKSIIPQET